MRWRRTSQRPAPDKSYNGGECLAKDEGKFVECHKYEDFDMYADSLLCDIKVYNLVTIDLEGLAQDKSRDVILPDGICNCWSPGGRMLFFSSD